jgi:alcohol dehydrogenase
MIPSYYEFKNSVKILSGKNALENIPFELKNLEVNRPIILTDEVLIKYGQVKILEDALEEGNIEVPLVYSKIPADSSVKVVNEIAKEYREKGCDSIIAIGGGSVIDTAKGVNILVSKGSSDIMEYMGLEVITGKMNPFIVVPSTAGTGSEVTLVAVIADPDRNIKMEFISYNMLPDVAVLDPRMTLSLPAKLTASTGMDALVHALEAYSCIQKNPLSDAYALSAINLIRENLIPVVENGNDENKRLAMANASLMAGIAFSNSMVGVVHAIGHALGGVCHVPHGDAMTILLPYGMEYNMDKVGEYYSELLLAVGGPEIYLSTPKSERAKACINVIMEMEKKLNNICGLPIKLRDVGVKKEDFSKIAKTAINDGAALANPVEVGYEDVLDILEKAY